MPCDGSGDREVWTDGKRDCEPTREQSREWVGESGLPGCWYSKGVHAVADAIESEIEVFNKGERKR